MTATVDAGKAHIDVTLLQALTAEGVRDGDARELARMDAFGGSPASMWIAGLTGIARLFNSQAVTLDWGTLPEPWDVVGPALSANGSDHGTTLLAALTNYSDATVNAVVMAITAVASTLEAMAAKDVRIPAQSPASPKQVAAVLESARYLAPIDENLIKLIQRILTRERGPVSQRRKEAGQQVIEWMATHGKFIHTPLGRAYYLHKDARRLYALDSTAFASFLYLLTGANPSSQDFRYFFEDCKTAGEYGEQLDVVRVAHWDLEHQVLRVSRFDGSVYRLDGATIATEANGDGPAMFADARHWAPYVPDFGGDGETLRWSTDVLPNWEAEHDEASLLYLAWVVATFFTELCPTRPILVIKGGKGSGKSMLLRVLLQFLFGASTDVAGVPDKPDAFTALTSNNHLVCLDNMDELTPTIRDKIASLSTGKTDELRELFTTNESYMVSYRCWLAVTSRTPDTLQRDDLVDRTLILPMRRIEDGHRARESKFLLEVIQQRNRWWGDVLTALNSVVAEIRSGGLPDRGGLRMEDWAALGTVMARALGKEDVWEQGLKGTKARQTEFLLEDDVILQAIEAWTSDPTSKNTSLDTRKLFEAASSALFGQNRPDVSFPRSVKSFGRRLAGIRVEVRDHLAKSGIQMTWLETGNRTYYTFN